VIEAEEVTHFVLDGQLHVVVALHQAGIELDVGLAQLAVAVVPVRRSGDEALPLVEVVHQRDAVLPVRAGLQAVADARGLEAHARARHRSPGAEGAVDYPLRAGKGVGHAAVDAVGNRKRALRPVDRGRAGGHRIREARGGPCRGGDGENQEEKGRFPGHRECPECKEVATNNYYPAKAIKSISTVAPFGSAAVWTVLRAGLCVPKYSA